MTDSVETRQPILGWLGFAAGAVALLATMVIFWAGPFAPQQSAGVTLGQLAADIVQSATRSVAGAPQPDPVAPQRDIDDYLSIAVGALAGLAIVLGVAGMIRHEGNRAAASGIALGAMAVGFQLFAYTVMMIAGAIVIAGLLYSLRDSFGDIFGG